MGLRRLEGLDVRGFPLWGVDACTFLQSGLVPHKFTKYTPKLCVRLRRDPAEKDMEASLGNMAVGGRRKLEMG